MNKVRRCKEVRMAWNKAGGKGDEAGGGLH